MKILGSISRLSAIIMLCVITSACSYGRVTIQEDHLKTSHNLLVIPYKAAPIPTDLSSFWVGATFGVVGVLVEKAMTEDWRRNTMETLNKAGETWNPSLVAATECSKVITSSSKVSILKTAIGETREIPGVENLRKNEPLLFKDTLFLNSNDWNNAMWAFRKTNASLVNYKKEHQQIISDWVLEVYLYPVQLTKDNFNYGMTLKLSSLNNDIIAAGFVWDKSDLPTSNKEFDFRIFEENFREFSRKSCTSTLKEMGIL